MKRMKKARRTTRSKALELAERAIALLPPRWRVKSLAELVPLAVLAFIGAALYAFAQLADEMMEGEIKPFDEAILRALRNPADLPAKAPAVPGAKETVSLRIDRDVLDFFQEEGPGWQERINAALRKVAGK